MAQQKSKSLHKSVIEDQQNENQGHCDEVSDHCCNVEPHSHPGIFLHENLISSRLRILCLKELWKHTQ